MNGKQLTKTFIIFRIEKQLWSLGLYKNMSALKRLRIPMGYMHRINYLE